MNPAGQLDTVLVAGGRDRQVGPTVTIGILQARERGSEPAQGRRSPDLPDRRPVLAGVDPHETPFREGRGGAEDQVGDAIPVDVHGPSDDTREATGLRPRRVHDNLPVHPGADLRRPVIESRDTNHLTKW